MSASSSAQSPVRFDESDRAKPPIVTIIAVVCALFAPAALAVEPEAPADEPAKPERKLEWKLRTADLDVKFEPGGATVFYDEHLMPRMNRGFDRYNGVWLTREHHGIVHQDVVYDVWHESASRDAERAVRKAVRDYMLEETSLSGLIDRLSRRGRSAEVSELTTRRRRPGTVRWDMSISHGLPRVKMKCNVGARGTATLKFTLGATGNLGVEFRPGEWSRTRLRAGYNADHNRYDVGAFYEF